MSSVITGVVNGHKADCVYGRDIKTWILDGVPGKTFADVIAFASVRQAAGVEAMTKAVSSMAELRQRKVGEIGEALATVSEAIGSMDAEEKDPYKRMSKISADKLRNANDILARYGIDTMPLGEGGQVSYATAQMTQTKVQNALDTEQNELSQMMTQLQGLVSKRDNSFTVAAKVVEKANLTEIQTIRAYGT